MSKLVYFNAALRQLNSKSSILKHSSRHLASFSLLNSNDTKNLEVNTIQKRLIQTSRFIQDAEKAVGKSEKYDFLAETKQLLNIVAKSLYSDKEVFVRELISNASDAIEKLKYAQLTNNQGVDNQIPYEIQINANDMNNTLTIQDTGVGMSKEELIKFLGTIAHSGSKQFIENLSKNNNGNNQNSIIGQFGVGFYSAFMVADKVQVFSKSYKDDEKAFEWSSSGDGSYEISEADGVTRGTKIILHLKDDCSEFSKEDVIRKIVNKYSNFVGYPIVVNGDKINLIQPIWLEDAKNITEEQHEEFYKFLGNMDKPRYTLCYKTDAPLNIRALFYIPTFKPSPVDISQEADVGVSLYSKKVLILSKANQILPRWLRFVKGVVDSEDIPLNLSRELLQDSNLIRKLRTVLTQRILRYLNEEAKYDEQKFMEFYSDYNLYFKEGIYRAADQNEKEEIASLLRFETNKTEPGKTISLLEYVKRMKSEQKNILYYAAPSREIALNSPYFEAIKQKDNEILFLFEQYDEMIVLQLQQFKGKQLLGIEQENMSEKNKDDLIIEGDTRSLSNSEAQELKTWLKTTLSSKIKNVKITNKLDTHPCVITAENMSFLRHLIKTSYMQREKVGDFFNLVNLTMEINPKNGLIKALYAMHKKDPELSKLVAEQLMDNSLVTAGLVEDPRLVLSNLNKLLEKAFAQRN
ncbi:unnamed protein product [Brachionus calyciflorus]|uniref:Heat shock protein 75 kDa, mitochondrial n=1 Tax=Brachionus calyciflorus TaxID=104777 RepID=A0A813MK04_9BILA|nr:unnamed protein product [Brachionus calyciflorus]